MSNQPDDNGNEDALRNVLLEDLDTALSDNPTDMPEDLEEALERVFSDDREEG